MTPIPIHLSFVGRRRRGRPRGGAQQPRPRPRDRGETDRVIELTGEALGLCASVGDRHREAALRNNFADLLHAAGREEESMEHLKRAVAIFAEIGEDGALQPEIWKLSEW